MAFVASNDQHGNEIMRVMLSTEPGKRTVASCHNLRINCSGVSLQSDTRSGRYDHRHRFHYFADSAPSQRQDGYGPQEKGLESEYQHSQRRKQKEQAEQTEHTEQTEQELQRDEELNQEEFETDGKRVKGGRQQSSTKKQAEEQETTSAASHRKRGPLEQQNSENSPPEQKNSQKEKGSQPEKETVDEQGRRAQSRKRSEVKRSQLELGASIVELTHSGIMSYISQSEQSEIRITLLAERLHPEKLHLEGTHTEKSVKISQTELVQSEKTKIKKRLELTESKMKLHSHRSLKKMCKLNSEETKEKEKANVSKQTQQRQLSREVSEEQKSSTQEIKGQQQTSPPKQLLTAKVAVPKDRPEKSSEQKQTSHESEEGVSRNTPRKKSVNRDLTEISSPQKEPSKQLKPEQTSQSQKPTKDPKEQSDQKAPQMKPSDDSEEMREAAKSQQKEPSKQTNEGSEQFKSPPALKAEGIDRSTSSKELKEVSEQQPASNRVKPLAGNHNLSVGEMTQWNSAEIVAHSTLRSMHKSHGALDQREGGGNATLGSAFYAWLAAKKEQQQQLMSARRISSEVEQQRAAERSRLAQEQYERWCQVKTSELRRAKSDLSSSKTRANSRQSLPAEETQRRLLHWEREKQAELKAQRLEREALLARQSQIDSTRRELSAEAWEQWMLASRNRPKPVPMGKGLDSLRGTNAPHFKNPNPWQPLLPTPYSTQGQATQTPPPQRTGPDYERLERLAQPRRKACRQSLNETVRLLPKDTNGSNKPRRRGGLNSPDLMPLEEQARQSQSSSCLLRPLRSPIIWSKSNAQRVREMRRGAQSGEMLGPRELHDDQVEQLRKQQDLQNNKVLPQKFQQKRELLRKKLKAWVEEGKALPERSLSDSCRNLKVDLKQELKQEFKQQQRRAVFVDETQRRNQRRLALNDSRLQRSDEQLPSLTRKPLTAFQRARSTEPKRLLRTKEAKDAQRSKPWR